MERENGLQVQVGLLLVEQLVEQRLYFLGEQLIVEFHVVAVLQRHRVKSSVAVHFSRAEAGELHGGHGVHRACLPSGIYYKVRYHFWRVK